MISQLKCGLVLGFITLITCLPAISAETASQIRLGCSESGSQADVQECVAEANQKSLKSLQLQQAGVTEKIQNWFAAPGYKASAEEQFKSTMAMFAEFRTKQCQSMESSAGGAAGNTRDMLRQSCEAFWNESFSTQFKRIAYGPPLIGYDNDRDDFDKELPMSPGFNPCPDPVRMNLSTKRESNSNCAKRLAKDTINKSIAAKSKLTRKIASWDENESNRNALTNSLKESEKAFYHFRESYIEFSNLLVGDFKGHARGIADNLARIRWYSAYTVQLNEISVSLAQTNSRKQYTSQISRRQ